MKISVVMVVKNAAATLEQALQSVAELADDIVVMEMASHDESAKIAKRFGARIFHTDDVGFVEPARNASIAHAKGDWILILDADESIPASLAEHLRELTTGDAQAYFLPRQNWVFGKAMEHTGWWPDYQLRFFPKGVVTWEDRIHSAPKVHGPVAYLPAEAQLAIQHQNYTVVSDYLVRLDRYTTIEAKQRPKLAQKAVSPTTVVEAFSNELVRRAYDQHGVADGTHGVALSLLQATYEMVVVLKQWERQGFADPIERDERKQEEEAWKALGLLQHQLNYWQADWAVHRRPFWEKWWWRIRRRLQR